VDVLKYATSSQNGRYYYKGVDITEFTWYYDSKTEWLKLSSKIKTAILKEKKELGIMGSKKGGKPGGKRQPKALSKKVKKMKVQIKMLMKQVSKRKKGGSGDDSKTEDENKSSKATGPNAFAKKKGS